MPLYKKYFFYILTCCPLVSVMLTPVASYGVELTYAEVINKAGRQRMLTQRITKTYCQIGLDVMPLRSRHQLKEAIDLYETQLGEIESFSDVNENQELIRNIREKWRAFRELALEVPSHAMVMQLMNKDEELLVMSDKLVQVLENQSNNPATRAVNISGRQRMLTQRLAKYYLVMSWGQASPSVYSGIDNVKNEFTGALEGLGDIPENTPLIHEKLKEARIQWAWFKTTLEFSDNEFYPVIVVDASEKLLKILENLTEMYQQLAIKH